MGELCGQRPAKIVALGAAMSKFAIVAAPDSGIYEPEQLQDTPVAVTVYNGSHFTTLKMLEGFLRQDEIKITNAGTMPERLEAPRRGELAAATFNEPWIAWPRSKASGSSWRATPPAVRRLATSWTARPWRPCFAPRLRQRP